MKINVKTLKGELFQIDAEPTNLVSELKGKIQDSKADHPAERQKLIHSGKVLKDEQNVGELGITEADFIVCMVTKEVAKKPAPAAAPVVEPTPAVQSPPVAAPTAAAAAPAPPVAPAAVPQQAENPEAVQALVGMGFPEAESRAALNAAMGNPDLAYEFLLTGIPANLPRRPAAAAATPPKPANDAVSIEQLRQHPQFNMLKQLVQQNPAALSQVLDLIGQQSPALLAAIHANNDAFLAMMNEPITDTPAPAAAAAPAQPAAPAAGNPMGGDPAQMFQMIAGLPQAQRAQFAQTMGMTPQQLEGFLQMMSTIPPEQLNQMLAGMGAGGAPGGAAGGAGGAHGGQHVIRLTEEEMAAVNRLMALGFSQQQAAQAYLACDKNEALAANLLLEGGWGDDFGGFDGGDHDHEDDMYH